MSRQLLPTDGEAEEVGWRPFGQGGNQLEGPAPPVQPMCAGSERKGKSYSQYTGVSRSGVSGRWRAQLCTGGKIVHLGTFPTAVDAARAWDVAAIADRGEHAQTNFDISDYIKDSPRQGEGSAVSSAQRSSDLSGDETTPEEEESWTGDGFQAHGLQDVRGGARSKRGRGSIDFLLNGSESPSKKPAPALPQWWPRSMPSSELPTPASTLLTSSQAISSSHVSPPAVGRLTYSTFGGSPTLISSGGLAAPPIMVNPSFVLTPRNEPGLPFELQRLLALCLAGVIAPNFGMTS